MPNESLLLVLYVSVLILANNFTDAARVIKITRDYSNTNALCKANLLKLNGFIHYLEKDYVKAII